MLKRRREDLAASSETKARLNLLTPSQATATGWICYPGWDTGSWQALSFSLVASQRDLTLPLPTLVGPSPFALAAVWPLPRSHLPIPSELGSSQCPSSGDTVTGSCICTCAAHRYSRLHPRCTLPLPTSPSVPSLLSFTVLFLPCRVLRFTSVYTISNIGLRVGSSPTLLINRNHNQPIYLQGGWKRNRARLTSFHKTYMRPVSPFHS